jgi:hypothetical protein
LVTHATAHPSFRRRRALAKYEPKTAHAPGGMTAAPSQGALMGQNSEKKDVVRIELTEEQKKLLREQTGQEAAVIEFSVEELEQRIAPFKMFL